MPNSLKNSISGGKNLLIRIYLYAALYNLGSVNQPGYNLFSNTERACLIPNVDLSENVGYETLKSNFLSWPCVSWTTKKRLPHPHYFECSVVSCGAKGLNKEKKKKNQQNDLLLLVFIVCLFTLRFVHSEEMESLSMKQLHIFGKRNVLKHMQRAIQVALLVNVKADGNTPKTLLLSLSFFLKFSSVQENPSNWKLVYTLQQ